MAAGKTKCSRIGIPVKLFLGGKLGILTRLKCQEISEKRWENQARGKFVAKYVVLYCRRELYTSQLSTGLPDSLPWLLLTCCKLNDENLVVI